MIELVASRHLSLHCVLLRLRIIAQKELSRQQANVLFSESLEPCFFVHLILLGIQIYIDVSVYLCMSFSCYNRLDNLNEWFSIMCWTLIVLWSAQLQNMLHPFSKRSHSLPDSCLLHELWKAVYHLISLLADDLIVYRRTFVHGML
jgi:hypothetical protein